jgi:hypothetical protein|eukprot:COSAG02_NODE_4120_length_5748_cov_5.310320_2_plen_140_part_00
MLIIRPGLRAKLTVPLNVVVPQLSAVKVNDALSLMVPAQHISWSYQTVIIPWQLEVEVNARGACRDYVLTQQSVCPGHRINRSPNLDGLCPCSAGKDVVSSDPSDICERQRCIYELDVARSVWGLAVYDVVAKASCPFR